MAPPRTVMRQTDDTVSTGLQQFLHTERQYVETLRSLDTQVARRLRFCSTPNPCPRIIEFLGFTRQLATLHALYADKLQHLIDDTGSSMAQIEAVMEDLLLVTRVVYAPLYVRHAQFKEALDTQLKLKHDDATAVLREFLQSNKLTTQQFIKRPVQHLYDLLERLDIIVGSKTMTQLCDATKTYLTTCEQDDHNEAQLIALQSQLRGSSLEMDLCGRQLLCRTDVTLSRTSSGDVGLVIDQTIQPLHAVYCLDDGTVLFLEQDADKESPPVGLCINLKNDAVFYEPVPRSIGNAVHPAAIVLAGPSSSLLVACKPEASVADFYGFVDCVSTLLRHNENRTQLLKHGRTADDFEIPDDLQPLLQLAEPPLMAFPCFHDDALPGMVWMLEPAVGAWKLVELVQFGSWVLLFAVSGWRRHHLIQRIDLAVSSATISEAPRSDTNWSLSISTAPESKGIELVSERRARIDFWYDQMTKIVEAAVVERKKQEIEAAKAAKAAAEAEAKAAAAKLIASAKHSEIAENEPAADASISVRAKKRQRNSLHVANVIATSDTTICNDLKAEEPVASKPPSGKKRRSAKAISAEDDAADTAQRVLGRDGETDEPTPSDNSKSKRPRASPLKTPKQRWVRRKTDDPDDKALESTPQGEGTPEVSSDEPVREPSLLAGGDHSSIRIIFTGIEPTPKTFKKINAIPGASYEENIAHATHVLAPKNTLKRTVKLLCGISICDHILDERWLDESSRVRTAVYERQYCLKDAKAEARWGFDLVKTMYDTPKDQRRRLFEGLRFFITPHKTILPPVDDLVMIVEQAGGSVVTSGTPQDRDLVVTSEAALATAAIAKLVAKCESVYTPELILSSILQQHLDTSQHQLARGATMNSGRTPQRSRARS